METSKPKLINTVLSKIKMWWNKLWINPKEAFYFLFIIFAVLMAIMVIGTTVQGGFFHFNTDDIIQYYPFMGGMIDKIKKGQLSLYDTTLFGGTSFFAGVYYLPFDVFTLITFILSYIMEAETAYSLANYLRVMGGSLLLFYVLTRKNMKVKTCFVVSIIYFIGGMTEAYYVFPVYLGINFYAPLAMLLCDLCIEKKGSWYLLLPLYSVVVILYDFYLAYMLLAFLVIYFLAESHKRDVYSFFGKKNIFVINKNFWISFGKCFGLVLVGVGMAAFMLIPSIQYVLNESSRSNASTNQTLGYFTVYDSETKKYVLSWRHYFTMWCNFFIPNEPHYFMLKQAGDYVKEHASFYMTCGGLVYLVYFFTINKKAFNRLKFWVILLNVLFLMPVFSMIFTANTQPYVRWFFIPFMFNLYAMALAIDENDFGLGERKWTKFVPIATMLAGLITLIYVIIIDPDYFIHYTKTDRHFYPLLGISIGIIVIYLIIYLTSAILELKKKNYPLFRKSIPFIIMAESIFACVMIFCNIDNTSTSYYDNKDTMTEMKETLYDFGYEDNSGYRINIYDNSAKAQANANSLIGNVNFGRFFQSFYNTPLNTCLSEIFRESSTSWSRAFNGGYNLLSSNLFTTKYVVAYTKQGIYFPEYYKKLGTNGNYTYYELTDMPAFIVYDQAFTTMVSTTLAKREEAILNLAYIYDPGVTDVTKLDPETQQDKIDKYYTYTNFVNTGIEMLSRTEVSQHLKGNHQSTSISALGYETINGNNYFYYDIEGLSVLNNDVLEVFPLNSKIREVTYEDLFIRDTNGNDHGMHYNTAYLQDSYTPSRLYIKTTDTSVSSYIDIYGYDYTAYTSFIEKQNQYTNKSFEIDGSKMYIKCTMPSIDKVRIIKTPYTYSTDWVVDGYDTVNVDGGFLGIVIKEGIKYVDIVVRYEPSGFSTGCKIAAVSCIIYIGVSTPTIVSFIRKRKEKHEEDSNNSALL